MENPDTTSATPSSIDPPFPRPIAPNAATFTTHPSGYNRLSLPIEVRLPLALLVSFSTGASLGLMHGTQSAALVFRAENAHRLPTTHTGWYFYHKSKNYVAALGGVKAGLRGGALVGTWAGGYVVLEEMVDWVRGRRDFASSAFAGAVVGMGYAGVKGLAGRTALRTVRLGIVGGAGYGVLQDVLSVINGRNVRWVDVLTGGRVGRVVEEEAS